MEGDFFLFLEGHDFHANKNVGYIGSVHEERILGNTPIQIITSFSFLKVRNHQDFFF